MITYTCISVDRFWRTIYQQGLWIPRNIALQLVSDGWTFTVTSSKIVHFETTLKKGVYRVLISFKVDGYDRMGPYVNTGSRYDHSKGWVFNIGGIECKTWYLWVPNTTKATYASAYNVSWVKLIHFCFEFCFLNWC